jgi:hydrogenase maturation protein HypF
LFAGNMREGFERVSHLRQAALPGGDAAASHPIQAAAGFLAQLNDLPDLTSPPFSFISRYLDALQLVRANIRCFGTTSMGRLFDAAAALLGFTREVTFEGQAAMWLEHLASHSPATGAYPFPFSGEELDFRPLLAAMIRDRVRGRGECEIARAFQRGIAEGLRDAVAPLSRAYGVDTIVLSGGVFQNKLLLHDLKSLLNSAELKVWVNHVVPPNDGGISLGQAALAALMNRESPISSKQSDSAWMTCST